MSSLEAQLSGLQRLWGMFEHRPQSQNCGRLGSSPACGSQNLPALRPIPAMTLDPVQVWPLRDIPLFLEVQKAKRITSPPSWGGKTRPCQGHAGKGP